MLKLLMMLIGLALSLRLQAFPCFLTLVKDSCWTNYNLSVVVTNVNNEKAMFTVSIPEGQSWSRQKFECQPKDGLSFSATFTPVFWESDADKVYPSQHNWSFPEAIAKGDTAWNMTICYPNEFSGVPLPPDAGGNCKCNTDTIPIIKPQ